MAIDFTIGDNVVVNNAYVVVSLAASNSLVLRNAVSSLGLIGSGVATVAAVGNYATGSQILSYIRLVPLNTGIQAYNNGSGIIVYFENDNQLNNSLELSTAFFPDVNTQRVFNATGSPLTKGSLVYNTGFDITQQLATVDLASAANANTAFFFGILLEDIAASSSGACLTQGAYQGLDTSSGSINQILYLSDTPGEFSLSAGSNTAIIGRIQVVGTEGTIFLAGEFPLGQGGGGGSPGATGVAGNTGITGNTGLSLQGATGLAGPGGSQGDTGLQGIQGGTGIQGLAGVTGLIGETGIQGLTGILGASVQGDTGIQGVTGIGIDGVTGLQGNTGIQGMQGVTGVVGDTGIQGLQGDTGIQGLQGVTGVIGDTGIQGLQGDTGIQGLGDTGIQGLTGLQGITGIGVAVSLERLNTTTVNMVTGATEVVIYNQGAGQGVVITQVVVRLTAANAITVVPTVGVGFNASGADNVFVPVALTGVTAVNDVWTFASTAKAVYAPGAATLLLGIDTGATGTTMLTSVDVVGYRF